MDLVYERTEGNPFFVEELVRFLVASGSLSLGDQGWDVTETSGLQMPNSVKLLVEERLERFEPGTRQVLAMAAVAGKEFALSLLQEVTGEEEDALVDAIDHAVEEGYGKPGLLEFVPSVRAPTGGAGQEQGLAVAELVGHQQRILTGVVQLGEDLAGGREVVRIRSQKAGDRCAFQDLW